METLFGNLPDPPYHKVTFNEIMVNRRNQKRRETIERRLKCLLNSGRIRRVTTEVIDFGQIVLYTYCRTWKRR